MEKQRPLRYPRRLSVSFTNGKSKRSGTTSNLSPSGIFINSMRAFSPGTSLKMVLEPEENKKIALEGIVVWVSRTGGLLVSTGMGIKLVSIPEEYENLINSWINTKCPLKKVPE